jgi:hypothetical protein
VEKVSSHHPISDRPPENELPVPVAAPEVVWRGDGIVFAIPSLQVYTTGAELNIVYRTPGAHPRTVEQSRQTREALMHLTVNGRKVTLLGGEHTDHGFTYRAWKTFRAEEANLDLVFILDWPGITRSEHRVPAATINEAMRRVTALWST